MHYAYNDHWQCLSSAKDIPCESSAVAEWVRGRALDWRPGGPAVGLHAVCSNTVTATSVRNFGNSVYPALPAYFGDTKSRRTLQARSQDFERGVHFGLTQSWGSGGRCKPPSWVRGGATEAKAFWQTKC